MKPVALRILFLSVALGFASQAIADCCSPFVKAPSIFHRSATQPSVPLLRPQ